MLTSADEMEICLYSNYQTDDMKWSAEVATP